jgi:exodeoxyribonuclease V alpha subunit
MNGNWPQALATQLLAWAKTLEPEFGGAPAETLLRCVQQLEAAREQGHVLIELGAVDAARLRASGLVDEPGSDGFPRGLPLVLDGQHLYLHRDHEHERALAARIAELLRAPPRPIAAQPLRQLFPAPTPGEIDWQALAVAQALRQRLTVISGGPGTGKTSTVVKLLACVLAAEPTARIALAAPTGKAAQRMLEALRSGLSQLPAGLLAGLDQALPEQALTLHRLLGADGRGGYRQGSGPGQQALQLDWLIVDEASMLDLALARQLFDALPAEGRLVLLGDRQQLAAVENGAVLAELSQHPCWSEACRDALQQALGLETLSLPAPLGEAALPDLALQFQRSHRFAFDSGIGRLAACLRDGDTEAALALLRSGAADLRWQQGEGSAAWGPAVAEGYAAYAAALRALLSAPGDAQLEDAVWRAWEGFRVLAAGHAGPLGTVAVNDWTANWLRGQLPATAPAGLGQALLVTRNLGELVNGDIALMLPDGAGALKAQLRRGSEATPLDLAPQRLPDELAGAFALTVHKAQGSEFTRALLLLPELEWTSREWLYTGATRARQGLALIGSEAALRNALARPTLRRSGLRAAVAAMP